MTDWQEIPLSETTSFIVDNRGKTAPTVENGIPLIKTKCINNDYLYPIYDTDKFVSQETYKTWFRAHPEPNDIIITLKGSQNGAVCLVPDPVDFVIAQDMVALRVNEEVIDPYFLFAALRSPDAQFQIKSLDVSGVIPHFKKSDFDKLLLPYPNRKIQQVIGQIYFSLSRKTHLLHRQNKTLENLAQTLFRHWFIEEAEDDWEEQPLDKIAHYLNGLACQKYPPENDFDKLPVLKIRELRGGISSKTDWATKNVPNKYLVKNGDVIFAWSGSLMVKFWDGANCVLNQHLFKVTSKKFPKWFYYLWTKHHLNKFIAIAQAKATTMGHIKRKDLSNSLVLIPKKEQLDYMDKKIAPLINKIIFNNKQIRTLEKLRDTLLPKLMSSEVRVQYE